MYRVLIVDDEEPVLESYSFLLEEYGERFTLAGLARSGYEAVQKIHELIPDVVFMDINIPGFDGIEAIEAVYKKYPRMVFVLSTAYERFEMAKRAIPLGVFAYLVKPVSKRTFLSTLDAIGDYLGEKEVSAEFSTEDLAVRLFLKESIWKPLSAEEAMRYASLFNIRSSTIIVGIVDAGEENGAFARRVQEKISYRHHCLYAPYAALSLFLICSDDMTPDFPQYFSQILEELGGRERVWALGPPTTLEKVHLSAEKALEVLRIKKAQGEALQRERFRIIQIRRRMAYSAPEELRTLFTAHWKEVFAVSPFPQAKAKMLVLFTLLFDDLGGHYDEKKEKIFPFVPSEEIMELKDLSAWEEWAVRSFDILIELFIEKYSQSLSQPLKKALAYINAEYTEPLQLADVADAAAISSAYLSRLFAEQLETNFIDYLTDLRIDRAERLLSEGELSVKEIAVAVGIRDPNYFGKCFKKATGLTPSLYAQEKRSSQHGEK